VCGTGDHGGIRSRYGLVTPRLPLYLYLAVYVVTCLIGGLLLLSSETFTTFVQLFTGVNSFWLSSEDVFFDLVLLFVAPVLFVSGYEIALQIHRREPETVSRTPVSPELGWIVFPWAITLIVAVVSLARGGAFENLNAWTDYRQWVLARWKLFDTLTFLEFANIYNFLPVATVLLVLRVFNSSHSRVRRIVAAAGAALPVLLVDLLIFQKKTFLIFAILAVLSVLTYKNLLSTVTYRRTSYFLALTGGVAYVLYCALVAGPAVSKQAHAMAGQPAWLEARTRAARKEAVRPPDRTRPTSVERPPSREPESFSSSQTDPYAAEPITGPTGLITSESPRRRFLRSIEERLFPGRWIGMSSNSTSSLPQLSRGPALFFYVILGPFQRTSMPALAYTAVYPKQIPFYGLDAGLDLVGIGQMPRDNIYVHHLLWPAIRGGTVMVPSQFSFHSQVGLGGALLLSALVGYLLAATWLWLSGFLTCPEVRAVACSLALIFAVYLAGDSLRNSALASYGVFWGAAFLMAWYFLLRAFRRIGSLTHVSLFS
jgi:hypothetical protein